VTCLAKNRAILTWHKTQFALLTADAAHCHPFFAWHFAYCAQFFGKTGTAVKRRHVTPVLGKKFALRSAENESSSAASANQIP